MASPPTPFAVCPGSLVPSHWHDQALLDLLGSRLNSTMINFIACKVVEAVRCRPSHGYPTPPESPSSEAKKAVAGLPPLAAFIKSVIRKSRCHVPTLLASAVYLERLRSRLPSTAQGCPTTRHRCALAAIVIAAKYLNDSSPMNKHWARYSDFSMAEINLMEMQLLAIFNFDLRCDEAELISVLRPLLQAETPERVSVRNSMPPVASIRSPIACEAVVTMEDGRRDEVVSRNRHYSVDAAAFAVEETGEAGKQLTPAYQRMTGVVRPRGPLPTPPPPVPPRPTLNHRISYPRHRRPGSTTPLSSPPPLLEGFTTLYSRNDRYSSRSSYSSSSTLSSTSSSSFGPRTPHTPLMDPSSGYPQPRSPIPPIPIPPPKTSSYSTVPRQKSHYAQPQLTMIDSITPLSWAIKVEPSLPAKTQKLSPLLSFAQPGGADEAETRAIGQIWPFSSTTSELEHVEGGGSARCLRRRETGGGGEKGHVRDRYIRDEVEARARRNLMTVGGGGIIEVK